MANPDKMHINTHSNETVS